MSEITEEQDQERKPQEFPGQRLKEAREAAGLTRLEVASRMRLSERMVGALEEDDYDVFPSATFVSGYLRSYARILGLPEEDFVKPVSEAIEPPTLVSTIGSKAQVSSRDLPVRLVTYLLVIIVIVSVAMWWMAQRDSVSDQQSDVAEVVESGGDIALAVPQAQQEAAVAESGETASVTLESAQQDGAAVETDARQPAETPSDASARDATSPAGSSAPAAPAEAPSEAVSESQEARRAEVQPPPLNEATPVSTLELRYQADSWTEVNDSAGRNLVYGLIKAGQVLELKGEAPFRVFLGYAPGVTVYYNNDLFDHSPFQRRDVARFRIGRAEHNRPDSR